MGAVQDKTELKQNNEKRLKLVGTEYKSEESNSQDQTKSKPGQIFKESTESISSMTKDMQEASRLVSTMKKDLEEKRSRIADLLATGSSLSDPFKIQTKPPPLTKHYADIEPDKAQNYQESPNQNYETLFAKIDMILEQNKEIIALLNSKSAPNTIPDHT